MTNEEVIKNLENDVKRYSKKEFDENTSSLGLQAVLKHRKEKLESYKIAINSIQENTKLKAEVERLMELMPKICETCEYEYEIGYEEPCNSCNNRRNWKLKSEE